MSSILQEIRNAGRALARRPGFVAVAVLTLALGIGANTAIFSVVNAVLLRLWPGVAATERLMWVSHSVRGRTQRLSYPDLLDYRERTSVFAALAGYDRVAVNLAHGGDAERAVGHVVTGGYFDVLGTHPYLGRLLSAADGAGGQPAAVVSYAFWKARLGSDPGAVGGPLTVNGRAFTVVGVAPPAFAGTEMEDRPAVWLPVETLQSAGALASRDSAWLSVIGRLRDGVGLDEARRALAGVCAALAPLRAADLAEIAPLVARARGWVLPGQAADVVAPIVLGLAATGLVLLIASANFANLLLVRAGARERELAVRAALGASGGRIVRSLLAESLLLAALGGAAGLLLAAWGTPVLAARLGAPANLQPTADLRVLAYALLAALAVGVVFGLAPARSGARRDVVVGLNAGGRGATAGPRRRRLQAALVVGQIALSLPLLAVAALLLRSFDRATTVDIGLDRERAATVLAVSFDVAAQGSSAPARAEFRREALSRVRSLAGVESAALAETLPLAGRAVGEEARPAGAGPGGDVQRVLIDAVSPGYFATLGIDVLAGREFAETDLAGNAPVAIVNQTLAQRFWPGHAAIGEAVIVGDDGAAMVVVGVARNGTYMHVGEDPQAMVYVPILQRGSVLGESTLLVRTADPRGMVPVLREAFRALDPTLPLFDVTTLAEVVSNNLADRRVGTAVVASFGALAALLAAVGLYGVLAHLVGQRTREIGTRLALGATAARVAKQIVVAGVRMTLLGVAIGAPVAIGAGVLLRGMLLGVGAADVVVVAGVAVLLTAVAAVASALPALRAARIQPVTALRYE